MAIGSFILSGMVDIGRNLRMIRNMEPSNQIVSNCEMYKVDQYWQYKFHWTVCL